MEGFIIALGIILMVIALVSCVLPPLPGPPVGFLALLMLCIYLTGKEFSTTFWVIAGIISVAVTYLDNLVAIWGTKKFGGTKAGIRGSFFGLIGGFFLTPFLGPLGIILGPFLGALIGELVAGESMDRAFKSGLGSFVGFLLGIGMKLIVTFFFAFQYFKVAFFK